VSTMGVNNTHTTQQNERRTKNTSFVINTAAVCDETLK
jgi:hypothetical protein